jgi:hypothetical protein
MEEREVMELMNGFLEWAKSAVPEEVISSLSESKFEEFLGVDGFDGFSAATYGPVQGTSLLAYIPAPDNHYSYAMAA